MRAKEDYDFEGKNVYLSGPMTGYEDWNRAAFSKYAWFIRDRCARFVFDPAMDAPHGEDMHGHEFWMRRCLHEVTREAEDGSGKPFYDVIALMPGWRGSKGALDEYHVARACGIEAVAL